MLRNTSRCVCHNLILYRYISMPKCCHLLIYVNHAFLWVLSSKSQTIRLSLSPRRTTVRHGSLRSGNRRRERRTWPMRSLGFAGANPPIPSTGGESRTRLSDQHVRIGSQIWMHVSFLGRLRRRACSPIHSLSSLASSCDQARVRQLFSQ